MTVAFQTPEDEEKPQMDLNAYLTRRASEIGGIPGQLEASLSQGIQLPSAAKTEDFQPEPLATPAPEKPDLGAYLAKRAQEIQYPQGLDLAGLQQAQAADRQRNAILGLGASGERAMAMLQRRAPNLEGLTPDQMNVRNYLAQKTFANEDYQRQLELAMQPAKVAQQMAVLGKTQGEAAKVAGEVALQPSEKALREAQAGQAKATTAHTELEARNLQEKLGSDSPRAEAVRNFVSQMGFTIDPEMTLGDALSLAGSGSNFVANQARAGQQALTDLANKINPRGSDLKDLQALIDVADRATKPGGTFRAANGEPNNLTKQSTVELSSILAKLYKGGVPGESELEKLIPPQTLASGSAGIKEWFYNNPEKLNNQAFVGAMLHAIDYLSETTKAQMAKTQKSWVQAAKAMPIGARNAKAAEDIGEAFKVDADARVVERRVSSNGSILEKLSDGTVRKVKR